MVKIINSLKSIKQEYIDAFKIEFNESDIKFDKETKQIVKGIKRKIKKLDKCIRILEKVVEPK